MEFQFQEKRYRIEFSRKHEIVTTFGEDKKPVEVLSKYPFTTAYLQEDITNDVMKGWKTIATATVGCVPTDPFTLESGRLRALKKLTAGIPKEMREPMWTCYHSRHGVVKKAKQTPPTPTSATATPVITPMMALDLHAPVNSYMVH